MRREQKIPKRSTHSAASSTKRSNALIEKAAQARNGVDLMNLVKISNYQAEPLAATLGSRTIGLQDLQVSKKAITADNELFYRTMQLSNGFKSGIHNTPKLVPSRKAAPDARSTTSKRSRARSLLSGAIPAANMASDNVAAPVNDYDNFMMATPERNEPSDIIKNALNRKKISGAYHTTLPMFMKSQGPFAVYDHALHRGEEV